MTVITIVIDWLGWVTKGSANGQEELKVRS